MKKAGKASAALKRSGRASAKVQRNGLARKNGQARTRTRDNSHAGGVSFDLQALLRGLQAMREGGFSVQLPGHWTGLAGKIADAFNEIVAANQKIAQELKRVGQVVGKEGKTRERVRFDRSKGAWGEMEASVNTLIDDLLRPTTEVTRAIAAVAQGNLTQTVPLEVEGRPLEGEFLQSATIVNTMIQQLGLFTDEVTRVAREAGTGRGWARCRRRCQPRMARVATSIHTAQEWRPCAPSRHGGGPDPRGRAAGSGAPGTAGGGDRAGCASARSPAPSVRGGARWWSPF